MGPQEEQADHSLLSASFREFVLRSQRTLDRIVSAHGASIAQAKLLRSIRSREETRSIDLAAQLGLSPRTITEAIDGMERAGLVIRAPDPNDRRAKILTLTPLGLSTAKATEKIIDEFTAAIFSALDDRESAQLSALLHKLTERLSTL